MTKYNLFLQLVLNNYNALLQTGCLKKETLDNYLARKRRARPVTIMLIAQLLNQNWQLYV